MLRRGRTFSENTLIYRALSRKKSWDWCSLVISLIWIALWFDSLRFSSRIYWLVKVFGFSTGSLFPVFFFPNMLNCECKNWQRLPYGQKPVSWNCRHALVLKLGGTCFFLTSSWWPCANEHVCWNLHVPDISQFLHISVLSFA